MELKTPTAPVITVCVFIVIPIFFLTNTYNLTFPGQIAETPLFVPTQSLQNHVGNFSLNFTEQPKFFGLTD